MISDRKNMWKSNLMLSDIPWDYYLHPCPTLYAKELSMFGPTLWVNPPTRNPAKAKLIFKNKNLIVFTPVILKRSLIDSGFGKYEVRLQIKAVASFFLGSASSVWSISTAYPHLLDENPEAVSIFWSGDFFSPEKEFESYKNFDLILCLTPEKNEAIPTKFEGQKLDFHMCANFPETMLTNDFKKVEDLDGAINKSTSFTKVAGYVGTLSSRRFDYELFLASVAKLPDVLFVVIGKSDGSHDTDFQIKKMLSYKNVFLINGIPYEKLHSAISFFDICLIPYKTDAENIGTCPTKFIDYCTTGKTVLSTSLPGLEKFGRLCLFANNKDEFFKIIKKFDPSNNPFAEDRIKLARRSLPSHFLEKFQSCFYENIHENTKI